MPDDDGGLLVGEGRPATGASESQECAGNPQAMWDYSSAGLERLAPLREEYLGDLTAALTTYRYNAGVASAEIPEIDPSVGQDGGDTLESKVGDLVTNWEYLDRFVGDVGSAFYTAEHGTIDETTANVPDADQVIRSTAAELLESGDIGYADGDAEQARVDGLETAEQVQEQLEELGIDPQDFDPRQLEDLDPQDPAYAGLFDLLGELEGQYTPFHDGFYNELGEEGIRATMGMIEHLQAVRRTGGGGSLSDEEDLPDSLAEVDVQSEFLEPFVDGFAYASDGLDTDVTEALLDPGDEHWKLHQLSMLLTSNGYRYDPQFLADASAAVLVDNPEVQAEATNYGEREWYLPVDSGTLEGLWGDVELDSTHLPALHALSDNPEASWRFIDKGPDYIDAIVRPDTEVMTSIAEGLNESYEQEQVDEIRDLIEGYGADIVTAAFLEAPLTLDANGQPLVAEADAIERYNDLVQVVGQGDVPDPIRESVAGTLPGYLDAIGDAAHLANREGPDAITQFHREDMVAFFEELGHHENAVAIIGRALGEWGSARLASIETLVGGNSDTAQLEEAMNRISLVTAGAYNGFQQTEAALNEDDGGFGWGAFLFGLEEGTSAGTGMWRVLGSLTPGGQAATYLLNFGASAITKLQSDGGGDEQVEGPDRIELKDTLVRDLRQAHVEQLANLDGIDVVIDQINRDREALGRPPLDLDNADDRDWLLVEVYGSEPFAGLNTGVVTNAFEKDADDDW